MSDNDKETDILSRLYARMGLAHSSIEANSYGNVSADPSLIKLLQEVEILCRDSIKEIEHLRSVAGAVSRGESFGDLRQKSKS